MSTLLVPTPSLHAELANPGVAILEKPVTIRSNGVTLPDGTPLTDQIIGVAAGFFLYRHNSSTVAEVWDQEAKQWRVLADGAVMALKPKPLAYKSDANRWEGLFVASADKDAVLPGAPEYFVRTFFSAPFGGQMLTALSAHSSPLHFVAMIDAAQGGLKLQPQENTTEVTLFLRNAAKQIIGSARLVNESGTAKIEVTNTAGAAVRLLSNGNIELDAPRVDVTGHLFVNGNLVL